LCFPGFALRPVVESLALVLARILVYNGKNLEHCTADKVFIDIFSRACYLRINKRTLWDARLGRWTGGHNVIRSIARVLFYVESINV
jgi:hypothetical protein